MNEDKPLNIGLIGCGNVVVYGHRPALTSLPQLRLIALADITPQRRQLGADWFDLREDQLYADYRDLLAIDALDAVVVAVPQQFRPKIALDALATGLHVLSEKPIANTPALAQRLVGAANEAGRVLAMVHNYHFLPEYQLIKQLLGAGEIGDLRVAMLHFLGVIDYPGAAEYQADWRHTLAAGGGVLMDMIHAVYLAEWLVGAPAQQVMAFIDAPEYAARQPVVEDLALLQIAFPRAYAAIQMGWGEGVGGVDISGADGHLRMRYKQHQSGGFNQPIELYSVDSAWNRHDHALANLPTHEANIARSFIELWADFAAAICEHRQPIAPAAAGARALEIVLGAYESAVTGRAVSLPLAASSPLYSRGLAGIGALNAWGDSKTVAAGLFGLREK
ncbi:MAG: Gfo/Idh/MocA family oxidoreductase [Chloroflexi bacterium]|nr:Gfo/Idh/MocA family oxidoreductase [Chloroflexota bacterium]MCY4247435.1 Gfo/Idh/MocA family oxidoreductase [Chloroflexota bacterium]